MTTPCFQTEALRGWIAPCGWWVWCEMRTAGGGPCWVIHSGADAGLVRPQIVGPSSFEEDQKALMARHPQPCGHGVRVRPVNPWHLSWMPPGTYGHREVLGQGEGLQHPGLWNRACRLAHPVCGDPILLFPAIKSALDLIDRK